jgi:hypothetical protein
MSKLKRRLLSPWVLSPTLSLLLVAGIVTADRLWLHWYAPESKTRQPAEVVLTVERKCQIDDRDVEGGWYGLCKPNSTTKRFDRLEVTVGRPGGATRIETISPQVQVNVGDLWPSHTEAWVFDMEFRCSNADGLSVRGGSCFATADKRVFTFGYRDFRYFVTLRRPDGTTWQEDFAILTAVTFPVPQVGGPWPPK